MSMTHRSWSGCKLGIKRQHPQRPVSGLTEVQVLHVSTQKEFSERQSDGQEIDLLRWHACAKCKWAGMEALPQIISEHKKKFSTISNEITQIKYDFWDSLSYVRR